MKTLPILSLAGALALAACGNNADETSNADPNADLTANGMATDATNPPLDQAAMPGSPQEFVDMASASDMFEIESAKVAQEMGSAQAVKDFAAMMIKDHSASTANLKTAAAAAQPALTVSPDLSAEQQGHLDELRQAGDGFDALYKEQQIAAHEKALSMLQGYADGDGPEPLKTFAGETAPVVEGHLDHVRELSVG